MSEFPHRVAIREALNDGPAGLHKIAIKTGLPYKTVQSVIKRGIDHHYFRRNAVCRKLFENALEQPPAISKSARSHGSPENLRIVLGQLTHGTLTMRELGDHLDRAKRSTADIVGKFKREGLISLEGRHYAITEAGLEKLAELDRQEASHAAE